MWVIKKRNYTMIHYVYAYLDTRKPGKYIYDDLEFEYEPFYIGQGKKYRCYSGLKNGGSPYKKYKINKILSEGFDPKVIKMYENLEYEFAIKLEIELISKIGRDDLGRGPLVNLTDGGEGTLNMSQIIKDKISEKSKGRKMSETAKENMKLSRKKYFENGNTTWNKGREWTEEERLKLTNKSNTGKVFSDSHKNKMKENAKMQMLEGRSIVKQSILVNKFTMCGDFIKEYESITNAANENNIPKTSIIECCKKRLKHAGGFYWEFKNK